MAKQAKRSRERGSIRERDGVFQVRVYAGHDPLTKQRLVLSGTATTPLEAEQLRTKLLAQVDEKRHPKSTVTVEQVLDRWMDVADIDPSTRERYEEIIRLYLKPTFGKLRAGELDAEMLERFYARLRRCKNQCDGRRNGKPDPQTGTKHECRPLAPNSVRKIHFVVRSALDRAVRWNYLSINVAEHAEPPAFQRRDPDPPSAEEAAAILNKAWKDPDWGMLLWLAMVTGCRRGELCALRWTDVDFANRIITIAHSYSQRATSRQIKQTKTEQKRRIAFDEDTEQILKAHRERVEQRCAALGSTLRPDGYVFSLEPAGSTALLPRSVTQRYRRMASALGLRSTRLHSLRHYSATELIAAGVDLRTVAGRLGHGSGGATTLRIYAAWVDHADRRAADTLSKRLPRPVVNNSSTTAT